MSKELLAIAEAVANERDISREAIFEALEAALAAATRKRYEKDIAIKVEINQKTGDYKTYQQWQIVDDDDILESANTQMRESVAAIEFPGENLKVGDIHNILIPNEPFGRISAQQAKQIILQKLKEAEREKIYQQFAHLEGTLVYGIVRRYERGNVIIDVNGIEGTILRENLIPRETLRVGDRVRGYLEKVNREMRGPFLSISRISPQFLIQLFTLEVPEIGMGTIEIMGAARDAGLRAKIAVRTFDPRIDPVGACVGIRGSRVQGVMNELGGERIDIVLWDEEPEVFVTKAMAPAVVLKTISDSEKKIINLIVADEKLPQAVGRNGQNVRLASILTGWQINVLGEKQYQEKEKNADKHRHNILLQALEINEDTLEALTQAGFNSLEDITYAEDDELSNVVGEELAEILIERATDYLFINSSEDKNPQEMEMSLSDLEGISIEIISALNAQGLYTREDLAELSIDELISYTGLNHSKASALILKAREPWFNQEA